MNQDQLKIVIDALSTLGAQGKEAFIWWLVLDKTVAPVAWVTVITILAYTVRKVVTQLIVELNKQ